MLGKKAISKLIACLLSVICVAQFCAVPQISASSSDTEENVHLATSAGSYAEYISGFPLEETQGTIIADFVNSENTSVSEYNVNVEKSGLYSIGITYCFSAEELSSGLALSLDIDGSSPFTEADDFDLKTPWSFGKREKDLRGNDIMPEQHLSENETFQWLYINGSSYNSPALFYFEKGVHTLKAISLESPFTIKKIILSGHSTKKSYKDYVKEQKGDQESSTATTITLEGEEPYLRSDSAILPKYDIQNANTNPSDPEKMLLNALDSSNWTEPGMWVEWKFDIKNAGWYEIDIKAQQSDKSGMSVYRQMLLDGKVPFDELEAYKFDYSNNWYMETLHNSEDDFRFYLDSGEHTLRMMAVLGDVSLFIDRIFDAILELNGIYRNVIMITGTSPDTYFDYDLVSMLPDLKNNLINVLNELQDVKSVITDTYGGEGDSSSLNSMILQLDKFISNINSIPQSITAFNSNITSLSAWAQGFNEQPLSIDTIYIRSCDTESKKATVGFFKQLWYFFSNIFASFSSDYGVIGEQSNEDSALEIWVSTGRDQAQLIKRLAAAGYEDNVNISLVQGGLLEAVMANCGPDIVLYVGESNVIDYAARGALMPLDSFSDFRDVIKPYNEQAFIPLTYNSQVYAIPLTAQLQVMFYRTDIFKQLGLECPKTWEELFKALPIIEGQNMNIGLGTSMFSNLLLQHGGSFYTDDLSDSALSSEESMLAFKKWTEFYTLYSCPISYNFFNRFRTGEMPLGIEDYSMYTQLEAAAPEISGLWDMAPMPISESGSSNVIAGGILQSVIILKSSNKTDRAWNFVKWFTSAETQADFGNQIEATLGPIARYQPANIDVISKLSWSAERVGFILSQISRMEYIEQTPSTSYVSRQINNAFRRVINDGENYRGALYRYNTLISTEILRKNKQLKKYY